MTNGWLAILFGSSVNEILTKPARHFSLALHWLTEAVFPRYCLRCGEEGDLLCTNCKIDWQPMPPRSSCMVCAKSSPWGRTCEVCERHEVSSAAGHFSSFAYADPVARNLILSWKYHFDQSAWQRLQEILATRLNLLKQIAQIENWQAVTPLPLHYQRFCERGFDQAAETARFIARQLNLPYRNLLVRQRSTGKQADRNDSERQSAMKKSPFIVQPGEYLPQNLLIVDDVWTTGATAGAAILTLKKAGVKNIWLYTLASGR